MKLPVLKLDQNDAEFRIDAMLEGEHRERVLAELRSSPDARKALELWREVEVLAPRRLEPYAGQLGSPQAGWTCRRCAGPDTRT